MSIIQEALRKAQGNTGDGGQKAPAQPHKAADVASSQPSASRSTANPSGIRQCAKAKAHPAPFSRSVIVAATLLLIAAIFFISLSLRPFLGGGAGSAASGPYSAQEVHYRALSKSGVADETTGLMRDAAQKNAEYAAQTPSLELNGIMYLEEGPRALINNSIVEVGDTVSGAKVMRIDKKSVVLVYDDVEITLNLK